MVPQEERKSEEGDAKRTDSSRNFLLGGVGGKSERMTGGLLEGPVPSPDTGKPWGGGDEKEGRLEVEIPHRGEAKLTFKCSGLAKRIRRPKKKKVTRAKCGKKGGYV